MEQSSQKNGVGNIIIAVAVIIIFILGMIFLFKSPSDSSDSVDSSTISAGSLQTVDVSQFAGELDDPDTVILDVRTPQEYSSGRIKGSQNIDFYATDFTERLAELDKSKNYKVYCNSGNRSRTAMGIMQDLGFENVSELAGGIQAWVGAGLETCVEC
ncbi:MAG: rhodanese-like domain-containing protein [Candidatus Dojkabacteria bacterium]